MLTYSVQGLVGGSSRELEMCRMGSPPSRGLGTLKSRENRSTDNVYSDKRPLPVADMSLVGLDPLVRRRRTLAFGAPSPVLSPAH